MVILRRLILLLLVTFFVIHDADVQQKKTEVKMTIFVHGAVTLGPMTPVTYFNLFMSDKAPDSLYEKAIQRVRSDPFFFESQPIKEVGFHQINFDEIKAGSAAEAFVSIFDKISKKIDKNDTLYRYYTFGWLGSFSKRRRKEYAAALYQHLLAECNVLRAQGFNPVIQIIGYCHGAQLTLELGEVAKEYGSSIPLCIDESILIGMPVSPDAALCVASPIFKKVIVITSKRDRVRPIDIFVSKQLWHGEMIPIDDPIVREKIIHIDLRVYQQLGSKRKGNPIFFDEKNNFIINRKAWRNRSPGHIELWFFQWTPSNYRKKWILAPFPAAVFLPIILQYVNEEQGYFTKNEPLIVDIRPEVQKLFVRQTGSEIVKEKPWLEELFLEELKKIAIIANPIKKRTKEEYSARIKFHVRSTSIDNILC